MDLDVPVSIAPTAQVPMTAATSVPPFLLSPYVSGFTSSLDSSSLGVDANKIAPYSIFCCDCGAPIDGTQSTNARCFDCLKVNNDISEGVQREATLHFCKRYCPPAT